MLHFRLLVAGCLGCCFFCLASVGLGNTADGSGSSHPPLRQNPKPAERPLPHTALLYVDPQTGNDANAGGEQTPWKTVQHALQRLKPGDTLVLREGIYRENVYGAMRGSEDNPITIRAYPGEQAILDGGLAEFFDNPQTAWIPDQTAPPGTYRSAKAYPNVRQLLGSFGDSMIGLQTYYHAQDLLAEQELVDWQDWDRQSETDLKPLYCGPGIWYDAADGHLYARLAHTHLPEPVANYRGETDPRNLPLLIAPFRSVPLHLDGAAHIRLQDLIVRGAGYTAVRLDHAHDVEFDNVTIWCGTYGIQASCTTNLRFLRSALYGNVAPWTFRSDGSKRDYPGRPHRNISRLNTHALLEIDSGRESSVYATPQNDHWEFAYSEFTDAHDAVYFGGINVRCHHNLFENMQDDGIYLSPMYMRHRLDKTDPEVHIYHNVFRGMLTALAFGGSEADVTDRVFIYRNVFDLTQPINTGRPTIRRPQAGLSRGKLMGDHGSPPWPAMNIYHNTIVSSEPCRDVDMSGTTGMRAGKPRNLFNNIFYHHRSLPGFRAIGADEPVVTDGNIYWSPAADEKTAAGLFNRYRTSPAFAEGQSRYPAGSTTHSRVADPGFVRVTADQPSENDFRLQPSSPAIGAGVSIPADWPDPLRKGEHETPDVGALPHGAEPWHVGRDPDAGNSAGTP